MVRKGVIAYGIGTEEGWFWYDRRRKLGLWTTRWILNLY